MLARIAAGKPFDGRRDAGGDKRPGDDRASRRIAAIVKAPAASCPATPAKPRRDARGRDRRATFKFGRLETPGGQFLACIVRDLSTTGARIALEGAFALPARGVLHIDETASRFDSRIVWTREKEAGLSFLD